MSNPIVLRKHVFKEDLNSRNMIPTTYQDNKNKLFQKGPQDRALILRFEEEGEMF